MNTVQHLLKNQPLSYEDKMAAKALGRPTPNLQIKKTVSGKTGNINRYFNRDPTYIRFSWMCGCEEVNKLFCFVCLLGSDLRPCPWTTEGVNDLKHLKDKAYKHESSANHLNYLVDYSVLGKPNICDQLNPSYNINIQEHNKKVNKNRHILRRLIMCVKFSSFELALNGPPENEWIFDCPINFAPDVDSALSNHLKDPTVSKTIQSELLDAMFRVCRNEISEQITQSNFVAIQADEITDSFKQRQLILVFRYVFKGELFEWFWGLIRPKGGAAGNIADAIMKELETLNIHPDKLIAQSYDGGTVMSGVQSIIRQEYPGAFYVHRHAHDVNSLLEKAASYSKKLKIFFAEVQSFAAFFSPKRASLLAEDSSTIWDFKTRAIISLYENKKIITETLEQILDTESDSKAISEANGLLRILHSTDFNYFLEELHYITPVVDAFLSQIRLREADGLYIQTCLKQLQSRINDVGDRIRNPVKEETSEASPSKRPRLHDNNKVVLGEYCNVLVNHIKKMYDFTGPLSAAGLFSSDLISTYKDIFPEAAFKSTVKAYPFLDKKKLETELSFVYSRDDMRCDGILPLLTFINKNQLEEGLSETYKLLCILCTTPMTTCESGRCFSTLKRIKCFLRDRTGQEGLNALAMLSVEKKLVQSIDDFDNKVMNVFASNSKHKDFNYK